MVQATYTLHVDADQDEIFQADEAVTSDVVSDFGPLVRCSRGKEQISQLSPPAAGLMEWTLDDGPQGGAGTYQPGGAFGLGAGQRARLQATYGGTTYDLARQITRRPVTRPGFPNQRSRLTCYGTLSLLAGKKIRTQLYQSITTDVWLGHVLDAAGWPKNAQAYLLDLSPAGLWGLGEASGDALDSSGNENDGTVTIGAGSRDATALDDAGDGGIDFDAADTRVAITDAAAIQNIFDGGGSIAFIISPDGAGEGGFGKILNKSNGATDKWAIDTRSLSGGAVHLDFVMFFSGTNGEWQTTDREVPTGETTIGVLTYDADDVANNPTLYLWNATNGFQTLTVGAGLTENSTPVGTRTTDAGATLNIGNNSVSNGTFDGVIDEVSLWSTALTSSQAKAWIARAVDAPRHLDTGKTTLQWAWADDEDAFEVLKRTLNTEGPGAAAYEDGTGAIVFKNRHARVTESRSTAVQTAFVSAAGGTEPLISEWSYDDGIRDVINEATLTTKKRSAASLAAVWSLGEDLELAAGESRTFVARTSAGDPVTGAVTPVLSTDYTVSAGSVASITLDQTSGGSIEITVTAGASATTVRGPTGSEADGLTLRAQAVTVSNTTVVTNTLDTSVSQAAHGIRSYTLEVYPEIATNTAQDFVNAVVGWYQDGRPSAEALVEGSVAAARMTACLAREIGDRVSVDESETGINDEFWVEQITQEVYAPSRHVTRFGLEVANDNQYLVWDVGRWDTNLWGW